jgi:hypothetical protein
LDGRLRSLGEGLGVAVLRSGVGSPSSEQIADEDVRCRPAKCVSGPSGSHISRGRPTDPHGAPSGGSGQRRCSSRVMGRARSASPCWCRTAHFGPGKVGHSCLSTPEPRTLGSPSSMISARDQRRGGRILHLGWLLPGTARGESDIRRVHPGLPETPKGNGGAVPSSPHICTERCRCTVSQLRGVLSG